MKYVQHKSGQGEKWKVYEESYLNWFCMPLKPSEEGRHYLPKSEYLEVPAPEVWKDVTSECETFEDDAFNGLSHKRVSRYQTTRWGDGFYRLRKVPICTGNGPGHKVTEQWAFIVEKKQE
jgi:hypothetical protein